MPIMTTRSKMRYDCGRVFSHQLLMDCVESCVSTKVKVLFVWGIISTGALMSSVCHAAGTIDANNLSVGGVIDASQNLRKAIFGGNLSIACRTEGLTAFQATNLTTIDYRGGTVIPYSNLAAYLHAFSGPASFPNLRLLNSSGGDTGWRFSLGGPVLQTMVPGASGSVWSVDFGKNAAPIVFTLTYKGSPLTPGAEYHIEDVLRVTQKRYFSNGHICGDYIYPLSWVGASIPSFTQSVAAQASVVRFMGHEVDEGTIDDGAELGDLTARVDNALMGQVAAVRWDPGHWTPVSGPATNRLSNGAGGALDVRLNCPGATLKATTNAPDYLVASNETIQCTVQKEGRAYVAAGAYPMYIQAAVYTP